MTQALAALLALRNGALLAVEYNPLLAAVTAALAAGLSGYPRAPRDRKYWSAIVLAAGWLIGDGMRILGRAHDLADGMALFSNHASPVWASWTTIVVWAVGSLAVGYVLPALAGATVGRHVTHGTGWLSAGAIASALVLIVSRAVGVLG